MVLNLDTLYFISMLGRTRSTLAWHVPLCRVINICIATSSRMRCLSLKLHCSYFCAIKFLYFMCKHLVPKFSSIAGANQICITKCPGTCLKVFLILLCVYAFSRRLTIYKMSWELLSGVRLYYCKTKLGTF